MTDTACPSCNAPAPAGARRCGRCGYRFLEGAGSERPRPERRTVLSVAAAAAAAAAIVTVVLLAGGHGDDQPDASATPLETTRRLEVLSRHPLATGAAERRLEERFTSLRDDDSAAVSCSEREPRPAHSLRRCLIRYPGGMARTIVLLTNASGTEVISER
jgi:ribosomal protein L40E